MEGRPPPPPTWSAPPSTTQVQAVRLWDKLGKHIFHEDMKKVFEPVAKSIKDHSEEVTKTITGTSNNTTKALENLNNKLLKIMNDRGLLASYLMSPLSEITEPEKTTQFKLVEDSTSNRKNDLVIRNTLPNYLHDNLLTFRDTGKELQIKVDLL